MIALYITRLLLLFFALMMIVTANGNIIVFVCCGLALILSFDSRIERLYT